MATRAYEVPQREHAILEEIIQYYLDRHEAISARTLAKISRLSLSPTTIRNLMEDLSTAGLLTTEGVTRGRIPTQKAFAIHVARLGERKVQPKARPPQIAAMEEGKPERLQAVVHQMGRFLAGQTGCLALAALPQHDRYPLDWVRFASMPDRQVLVTLRTLFGDLWCKLLVSADPFPDDLLEEVGRFINTTYRGRTLAAIRNDIMAGEPKELLASMPSLGAAFRMLRKAFEWEQGRDRPTWGTDNLYRIPELHVPEQLLSIHRALSDAEFLSDTLQRGRRVNGGWIAIGTETGYPGLENCALTGYPFGWRNWQGLVAVLGPMRMNYAQVFGLTAECAGVIDRFLQNSAAGAPPQEAE